LCPFAQDEDYYVGSAKAVTHRLRQHRSSRGAKFTRDHGAARLVHVEGPFSLPAAIQREFQLKRWSHAKKAALTRGDFGALRALSHSRTNHGREAGALEPQIPTP
jgi:putative endonuclease